MATESARLAEVIKNANGVVVQANYNNNLRLKNQEYNTRSAAALLVLYLFAGGMGALGRWALLAVLLAPGVLSK